MAYRYTYEDRKKVRTRIKQLLPLYTYEQIAQTLKTEGFKRPDGTAPTAMFVGTQVMGMKKRPRSTYGKSVYRRKTAKAYTDADTQTNPRLAATMLATPDHSDRKALADLVYGSALPKDYKLRLLTELL